MRKAACLFGHSRIELKPQRWQARSRWHITFRQLSSPPPPLLFFFFKSTLNVTYCPFRCYWEADCFFFFSHKCYSWSVLSLLFILLTPAYKGTLTYLHLIPLPFCILWMFPCVGAREKERVVSPPQISTEQHVADVKKACRFPLSITTGVLEGGERGGVY